MRILGFSGRIGSGKTTAAEYLHEKLHGEREVWIKPFAQDMKDFTSAIFAIDYLDENHRSSDWANQEFKNKVHPCGKTYRQLAKEFGTDFCRKVWPDIWIYHWGKGIDHVCPRCGLILVPDVRFPNELRAIQERGGHVIRLLRAPHPEDNHETETALDEVEWFSADDGTGNYETTAWPLVPPDFYGKMFDACIDNRNLSIEAMQKTVWELCNERGWI